MTQSEMEKYWKKQALKTISRKMNPDNFPHKISHEKRSYKGERECIKLAIQPMMHTAYIQFSDTKEIVVAPERLLHKIHVQPKSLAEFGIITGVDKDTIH